MGPKIQTKWPKEEEERLLALLRRGLTSRQIGDIMKKTRNAVIGKINRLGIRILNSKNQPKKAVSTYVGFDPLPPESRCHWPIEDGWCSKVAKPGQAYCCEHDLLAYKRPTPPDR